MKPNASVVPERLKEARMARGYTMTELADAVGVSRQAISQYELGHITPSGGILARLVEELDIPFSYMVDPITEAKPSGPIYFRSLKSTTKKSREMLSIRAKWMTRIFNYVTGFIEFPEVRIPNLEDFGLNGAIDQETIEMATNAVRQHWGLGLGPIDNVLLLLENNGVIVSRFNFGDEKADACSQWVGDRLFVYLCDDKGCAVRSRLDAVHELGHALFHMCVDDEQLRDPKALNRLEDEAYRFGSAFLMPRDTFPEEVVSSSLEHFIMLKRRWKVSIAAMIYRCQDLGILSDAQILYLRKRLSKLKYRTKEPLDDELPLEQPRLMAKAFGMLLESGLKKPGDILDAIRLPAREIEQLCNLPPGTLDPQGKVIRIEFKDKTRGKPD